MTHGTVSGYERGCRCDPCRAAKAAYRGQWRAQRGPEPRVRRLAREPQPGDYTVSDRVDDICRVLGTV